MPIGFESFSYINFHMYLHLVIITFGHGRKLTVSNTCRFQFLGWRQFVLFPFNLVQNTIREWNCIFAERSFPTQHQPEIADIPVSWCVLYYAVHNVDLTILASGLVGLGEEKISSENWPVFIRSIYHKPICFALYTRWDSFCSKVHRIGLIEYLASQTLWICHCSESTIAGLEEPVRSVRPWPDRHIGPRPFF